MAKRDEVNLSPNAIEILFENLVYPIYKDSDPNAKLTEVYDIVKFHSLAFSHFVNPSSKFVLIDDKRKKVHGKIRLR